MDSDGLNPVYAYASIRRAETGVQLEQVFRALSFLLHDWRRFGFTDDPTRLVRKGRNGKPDRGRITVIEFDKFVNIACRLWTKLFQATGSQFIDRVDELDEETKAQIVRYKPPVDEVPGLHGPGEARTAEDGDKVVYVVAMLKMLADEGISYFTFQTRSSASASNSPEAELLKGELFDTQATTSEPENTAEFGEITRTWGIGESTEVEPGIRVTDDAHFWEGFTDREIRFLRDLSNALKRLGPTEIRAIGTHKDSRSTVKEVRRELRWANKQIKTLLIDLPNGTISLQASQRLHMSVDEALRKSEKNKDDYATGYALLYQEIQDSELRTAFTNSQKPPEEVWNATELPTLAGSAASLKGVAKLLHALAYFQTDKNQRKKPSTRRATSMLKFWTDGRDLSKKKLNTQLPSSVRNCFDVNNLLKPEVSAAITTLLAPVRID